MSTTLIEFIAVIDTWLNSGEYRTRPLPISNAEFTIVLIRAFPGDNHHMSKFTLAIADSEVVDPVMWVLHRCDPESLERILHVLNATVASS